MSEEQKETARTGITATLIDTAGMIVAPLRTAALVTLGGTALLAEVARRQVLYAAGESERQLELFSRSVRRTTLRLWRRRGPQAAPSSGRSAPAKTAS
jgi:hypothetical protein